MRTKVIFAECSEYFWVDVAKRLRDEFNWQPCYWIAGQGSIGAIKEAFPEIVVHKNMDAVKGIFPKECQSFNLPALDEPLLKELSVYESIVFNMMDRMDTGYAFSYQERIRLYHRQIKYWLSVLDYYKPDVVVFPNSPHLVCDYVLYMLCKKMGVKTIMFRMIEGFICPIDKIEGEADAEADAIVTLYKEFLSLNTPLRFELSLAMEHHWRKKTESYDIAAPFVIKEKQKKDKQNNKIFLIFKKFTALFKYICFIFMPAPPNYLKLRNRSFEDSKMSYIKFVWLNKFKGGWKKRCLRSLYDRLSKETLSLDKPYVYVALHYQPEKSSSPDGGIFVNQLLMVDLLSKALPEGWSLYVREHPYQFASIVVGERSRSFDFYYDIISLPNVKLAPLSLSSFDLIDNAKAVATITGTVGWEAVLRGKPVLIFGNTIYRGCEGVFYTPTQQLCNEILSKIQNGYKVNREKVKIFLYVLERVCFRGYVDAGYEKVSGVPFEENIISISKAIESFYEKLCEKQNMNSVLKTIKV